MTCALSYQYAESLSLQMPKSWKENKHAGIEWLESLRKRHRLFNVDETGFSNRCEFTCKRRAHFRFEKAKKKKKHLLLHPLQKKRITSRRFQVQKMSEMLENRPQNLQHLRKFVCVQELRLMFSCLPFMNCIFYCCEFISHYFPFYFQNKVISVDESEKKRMFWVRFRKCSLQHLNGKISNDEGNEHCFCETEMFLVEHRSSILCIGQWRLTFRIGMLEK